MPKLEIQKYLVASTAHVTQEDMRRLRFPSTTVNSHEFPYGETIYVGTQQEPMWKLTESEGYSNSMQDMLKLALKNHCAYLKLDCDGPIIEGYIVHDW